jgi:DNA modification methylase
MLSKELPVDQILMGDCLEILSTLPKKSIDLIFADPPYNLQLEKQLWRPNSTRVNGVEETWDQFSDFESYDRFTVEWLAGCRNVLKDTGTIWVIGMYHNIFRVGKLMQDLGFWILNDIVWIKNNPMPNFHGVRFTNAHETLIWAQKKKGSKYTFNYHTMKSMNAETNSNGSLQMRSDWMLPLCTGKERLRVNGEKAHPTQKPEALLQRVIMAGSNPGDIVLDPFMGSGTTGAVAKKLGRHWIGIESNESYVALAQRRISGVAQESQHSILTSSGDGPKARRIPFMALIKHGDISIGQTLLFDQRTDLNAHVLPDGRIQLGEMIGSIHTIGREISRRPCNGWQAWYYFNELSGRYEPIDVLRTKLRNEIDAEMANKVSMNGRQE